MTENIINNENIKLQGLLENYLRFRSAAQTGNESIPHPDEDVVNAFVEGNLSRRENLSIVSHLVDCGFCLHRTAELARLQAAFEAEDIVPVTAEAQPTRVSEVLSGLLSRLFGSTEGAVFAHEEKDEKPPSDEKDQNEKDPD